MPTYNRSAFIKKAIQSVINQTYSNWELIIIDDGSTDNTKEVIKPYLNDQRIIYMYQQNQERSAARNNGVKVANGEYICFLDSDDYYLPNHLEIFYKEIVNTKNNKKTIFVTKRSYKENQNERIVEYNGNYNNTPINQLIYQAILSSPPVQCICIRKEAFETLLFSDEWLPYSECNHFSFELLNAGYNYKYINNHTVVMVNHDSNTTNDSVEFYMGKLSFLTKFSNILGVNSNQSIIEAKEKLLLFILVNSCHFTLRIKYFIRWVRLNPRILFSRSIISIAFRNN